MSRFRSFWRNLVHRRGVDRDLDDELRSILELLEEEKVRGGLEPAEARRAATVELGRIESLKEQVQDVRAGAFWDGLVRDTRQALRLMLRSPVFTAFAVASLALGIGATGAMFSLFDAIVLRTLPVAEPDRLVVASFGRPGGRFNYSLPYPQFEQMRERTTTLDGLFAIYPFGRVTIAKDGDSDIAQGVHVTGDYHAVLGLVPALGRLLTRADDRPGEAVAVLGHAYWQRRFGGSPDVLGATVTLNGIPFTIVGVEPAAFRGVEIGRPYDIAIPMRTRDRLAEGDALWDRAFATWIYVMGRLKRGSTLDRAEQELDIIFRQVSLDAASSADQEQRARGSRLKLEPGAGGASSDLRNEYDRWLRLVLMALAAVLVLASLNVATLLLSRSDARQRETATRLALGASRGRIIRQFLTESLVLAAVAGAIGFALASWGSATLLRLALPARESAPVELDPGIRVFAFTVAVSAISCLLFGLVPAIRATSPRPLVAARQIGGARRLLDRALVACQVALSLVLLVAAGLFLRTLGNLWAQDTGYDRRDILMFSVDAHLAGKRGIDVPVIYQRLLDQLAQIPAARSVTVSSVRPVSDGYYFVDGVLAIGDRRLPEGQAVRVAYNNVGPQYFATLGVPLVAGRDFDARDSLDAPAAAIISQRMARHFSGNPVGQDIALSGGKPLEVVGVAADVRYASVKDAPREVVYLPFLQQDPKGMWYSPTFEIRYSGSLAAVLQAARTVVARVDPGLVMFRVRTLEAQTRDSLARERLLAVFTSYFGGFAVLLACVGLYGLMSYGVTRRTAEIGLRLALGSPLSGVRRLVIGEAAAIVAAGSAMGLVGSFVTVRLVQNQLFGVAPHDPVALAAATLLLLILALTAAYLPARRAARIDPLAALRHE